MPKKNRKSSKSIKAPQPQKSISREASEKDALVFSLQYVNDKDYSPRKCGYKDLKSFFDKLRLLSSVSWNDIEGAPRTTIGYEPMPRGQIKPPIPDHVPKDRPILVFRYGGGRSPGRIGGYRDKNAFFILFVGDFYEHLS